MATVDNEPEDARQRSLDELGLDEFAETAYDDLVRTAADVCQTPVALISIIDGDRQWFKAKIGTEVSELPRESAFCALTILDTQKVLVVEDATQDPRFAAHPLVSGPPYIRFYAGAPLVTSAGQAIGTVCVLDTKPRSVSEEQLSELRFLARQVIVAVEERKRRRDSENSSR